MKKLVLLSLFTLVFHSRHLEASSSGIESYKVKYQSAWTQANFPKSYPSNAHFSPLVVVGHSQEYSLFSVGSRVSAGVKDLAETGSTNHIKQELNQAIRNKSVLSYKVGLGIRFGGGSTSALVNVSKSDPFVSAISMIAPSPDWVVGLNNLSMLDNEGDFIDYKLVPVYALDAGTDSGKTYKAKNVVTSPAAPLMLINANPLFINKNRLQSMGYFVIERVDP